MICSVAWSFLLSRRFTLMNTDDISDKELLHVGVLISVHQRKSAAEIFVLQVRDGNDQAPYRAYDKLKFIGH